MPPKRKASKSGSIKKSRMRGILTVARRPLERQSFQEIDVRSRHAKEHWEL